MAVLEIYKQKTQFANKALRKQSRIQTSSDHEALEEVKKY